MEKHPADLLDTPDSPERVFIRPYPKVVLFYPTMLIAIISAIIASFAPDTLGSQLVGRVFFLVFFFNILVIAFDFTRVVFVATMLFLALLVTLGFLLESKDIEIFRSIKAFLERFDMKVSAGFYLAYGLAYILVFIGVFIQTRFDYWEVKHNELLHHHGLAGDVERLPATNLRVTKEITDVFEYMLLLSGRLVLQSGSERPVVLDHVVRINAIEKRLESMLQTTQVSIQGHHGHPPTP